MSCRIVGSLDESGQATVEYAVITGAFLVIAIALAALWRQVESGLLVEHALAAASHHVQLTAPGFLADIFLY